MIQALSETHRHHPDTPQTDIGTLRIRRQRKKRDYLSWHDYTFLPTDLVLIHTQTPSDLTKTLPDTIQTPQDIRHFHAIQGTERKCNNSLTYCVLMLPQTPSDTIWTSSIHPQTPSRHPQTDVFAIEGTWRKVNIYSLIQILQMRICYCYMLHPDILTSWY